MTDQEIDQAILSAVGADWKKAASTVAKTGDALGVGYSLVAARMTALIKQGMLEWDGGEISDARSWIKALVRNSNQDTTQFRVCFWPAPPEE